MGRIGGKNGTAADYEDTLSGNFNPSETVTPLETAKREFKTGWKGYNRQEVRRFLEGVSRQMEASVNERNRLLDEIRMLQDRINGYMTLEETLQKTLLTAQQTQEDMLANARKEADLIVADARSRAHILDADIARKRSVKESFVIEFEALLTAFLRRLREPSRATPEDSRLQREDEAEKDAQTAGTPSVPAGVF